MENHPEAYNVFDEADHLQPNFNKSDFENLHDWDLGWEMINPINIGGGDIEAEVALSRRLSPGQKALYFFWYLDAQVVNGGFDQFFWNGYYRYMLPIIDGLKLIEDDETLNLVSHAYQLYLANKSNFVKSKAKDEHQQKIEKELDALDDVYYRIRENTINLFEGYIRSNPGEFVRLI